MKYEQVISALRPAYDRMVEERDSKETADWKIEERAQFLALLQEENKTRLLEIGAGTGVHGKFFQDSGLRVTCTDLSREMVKRCREKGLEAYAMDFLRLDFPESWFEAIFAMNCLLHVPKIDLPRVLDVLHKMLQPGGLFYWGQYGGIEREGVWQDDHYKPQRFFCLLPDDAIKEIATLQFQLARF